MDFDPLTELDEHGSALPLLTVEEIEGQEIDAQPDATPAELEAPRQRRAAMLQAFEGAIMPEVRRVEARRRELRAALGVFHGSRPQRLPRRDRPLRHRDRGRARRGRRVRAASRARGDPSRSPDDDVDAPVRGARP